MKQLACLTLTFLWLPSIASIHAAEEPVNATRTGDAQRVTVTFAGDNSIFPNPERGIYFSTRLRAAVAWGSRKQCTRRWSRKS